MKLNLTDLNKIHLEMKLNLTDLNTMPSGDETEPDWPQHNAIWRWNWTSLTSTWQCRLEVKLNLTDLNTMPSGGETEPDWPQHNAIWRTEPDWPQHNASWRWNWTWLTSTQCHLEMKLNLTDLNTMPSGDETEPDWPQHNAIWRWNWTWLTSTGQYRLEVKLNLTDLNTMPSGGELNLTDLNKMPSGDETEPDWPQHNAIWRWNCTWLTSTQCHLEMKLNLTDLNKMPSGDETEPDWSQHNAIWRWNWTSLTSTQCRLEEKLNLTDLNTMPSGCETEPDLYTMPSGGETEPHWPILGVEVDKWEEGRRRGARGVSHLPTHLLWHWKAVLENSQGNGCSDKHSWQRDTKRVDQKWAKRGRPNFSCASTDRAGPSFDSLCHPPTHGSATGMSEFCWLLPKTTFTAANILPEHGFFFTQYQIYLAEFTRWFPNTCKPCAMFGLCTFHHRAHPSSHSKCGWCNKTITPLWVSTATEAGVGPAPPESGQLSWT